MTKQCSIIWLDGKPEIAWVYNSLEEADKELERLQEKTEVEMKSWKTEAASALEKDDLYRGGGILSLAELMKKHSAIVSLRVAMKHWEK